MENNKGKGIKQQIEESNDPKESMDAPTKSPLDEFLEDLASNTEYPDDMEIFTVGKGWHKIKDYR